MITFSNPGTFDLRSATLIGASAKQCEDSIGLFGTGLKYAIAILLREQQKITIISQGEESSPPTTYTFTTKEISMRGKSFSIICCNGEELSYTTEYGKKWELWQALRELYANCLDEGGEIQEGPKPLSPR